MKMNSDAKGLPKKDPDSQGGAINRRSFLRASGGVAATFALSTQLASKAFARPVTLGTRTNLNFLMQRATRGYNRKAMDLLQGTPLWKYRKEMLDDLPNEVDTVLDTFLLNFADPLASKASQWIEPSTGSIADPNATLYWTFNSTGNANARTYLNINFVARAIVGKSHLEDRVADFFRQHFNIWKFKAGGLLIEDDREVIRKNALGSFPDMLKASAKSAAMLQYLDNERNGMLDANDNPKINENYARELLELHTIRPYDVGDINSTPHYTQDDVEAVAAILTGWRYRNFGLYDEDKSSSTDPIISGEFYFDPSRHIFGEQFFNGQSFGKPPHPHVGQPGQQTFSGQDAGDDLLDYLVDPGAPSNTPGDWTAFSVAEGLCKFFLSYNPDTDSIRDARNKYRQKNGNITDIVRNVLSDDNLTIHNTTEHLKLKTPVEFICSLFLATEATLLPTEPNIEQELTAMGQGPNDWHHPNGYPDEPGAWTNLITRWSFAARFFLRVDNMGIEEPGIPGIVLTDDVLFDMLQYTDLASVNLSTLSDNIEEMLVGACVFGGSDKDELDDFVSNLNPGLLSTTQIVRESCAFASMLPSFQYF
ncbi:MAG: hypothetical protein ACI8X5_003656 [Planctomycetota bacterium]|jgi:uncharacterized protein (DUF1800 family)